MSVRNKHVITTHEQLIVEVVIASWISCLCL